MESQEQEGIAPDEASTNSESPPPTIPPPRTTPGMMSLRKPRPTLQVAVAAVKRVECNEEYTSADYEVCLLREGPSSMWHFITNIVKSGEKPEEVALRALEDQSGFTALECHSIGVQAKPNLGKHDILLLYMAAVQGSPTGYPSVETCFHVLEDVVDNLEGAYDMPYPQRELIHSLDTWLNERHAIPYVSVDLIFLCSNEGEGIGGLVKAIVDNPLNEENVCPKEDQLILGFNNPMFTFDPAEERRISRASSSLSGY